MTIGTLYIFKLGWDERNTDGVGVRRCVSGAGTNFKVGVPVRRENGGNDPAQKCRKIFFWSCPSTSLVIKVQ